jgi:rhodanese-related sulfurtransferase
MSFRPSVPTIEVTAAQARLVDGEIPAPLLLDVREPADFRTSRAPGAVLRPVSTFHLTMGSIPRDRPLLVICYEGNTSAAVTAFLLRQGWSDVASVEGGMNAWRSAGLPTRLGPLAAGEGELPGADPG